MAGNIEVTPPHVFPARAGMSPTRITRPAASTRVPRASGDEPCDVAALLVAVQCSPRERG